jgi:hypothetical protein
MGEAIVLNGHRSTTTLLRYFQPRLVSRAEPANLVADDRDSSIKVTETVPIKLIGDLEHFVCSTNIRRGAISEPSKVFDLRQIDGDGHRWATCPSALFNNCSSSPRTP